jgi:hypothetical protein
MIALPQCPQYLLRSLSNNLPILSVPSVIPISQSSQLFSNDNLLILQIDVDGDSNMHSSPELDAEDEMFPDEAGPDAAGPSTPQNAAAYSLPPSELSPPNSQGGIPLPRDESFLTNSGSPSALNANGKRVYGAGGGGAASGGGVTLSTVEGGNVHEDKETGYQWVKTEEQPGFEWKNNRAKEEETRALEQIVDKSHMIKSRFTVVHTLGLCANDCSSIWRSSRSDCSSEKALNMKLQASKVQSRTRLLTSWLEYEQ